MDCKTDQVWGSQTMGVCVLNDALTSNHVHLLIQDTQEGVITRSPWSDAMAVGCELFVGQVKAELGRAVGRLPVAVENKTDTLRETSRSYRPRSDEKNRAPSPNKAYIGNSTNT